MRAQAVQFSIRSRVTSLMLVTQDKKDPNSIRDVKFLSWRRSFDVAKLWRKAHREVVQRVAAPEETSEVLKSAIRQYSTLLLPWLQ